MIRIKTKWDNYKVLTIPLNSGWYTLAYEGMKVVYNYHANSFFEAGQNHLQAIYNLKKEK